MILNIILSIIFLCTFLLSIWLFRIFKATFQTMEIIYGRDKAKEESKGFLIFWTVDNLIWLSILIYWIF